MAHSRARQSTDNIVDEFVARINAGGRERLPAADVPGSLRLGSADNLDYYDWNVRGCGDCAWIGATVAKLPGPLPPSFRSLVERYLYPAFDVGSVHLFANTGEAVFEEFAICIFADAALSGVLLPNGYVQFGKWRDTYDPVCFDLSTRKKDGEYAAVALDHEAALCNGLVRVHQKIAPSFLDVIRSV